MTKIRALHVINAMKMGGAEILLRNLLPRLPQEGIDPHLAIMLGHGAISDELRERDIPVIDLSRGGKGDLFAFRKIHHALKERGIDIIHTHSTQAAIAAYVAGALAGVPIVSTRHSVINPKSASLVYRIERALTRRRARAIVAVSAEMREKLLEQKLAQPERCFVHRNAVDLSHFHAADSRPFRVDAPILGTIGRMEAPKAQELFLETVAKVRERIPGVKGILVGDGSRRAELEECRRELELEDVVDFPGRCRPEDVPRWLAKFDVFVLSSRWEGLPVVLIEAAAARLPIVAASVGGVHEVVQDEETGLLVPEPDGGLLAEAVFRLTGNPELADKLARNAHEHAVKEFDMQRLAEQTAQMYRLVLNERQS